MPIIIFETKNKTNLLSTVKLFGYKSEFIVIFIFVYISKLFFCCRLLHISNVAMWGCGRCMLNPVLVYTLCIFIDDKFADLRRGFVLTAYLCSGCICCFRCVNDSQTVSGMLSCHSILIQQALDCVYQQD